MLGGIASQEITNYDSDLVTFKVDESAYNKDLERVIQKDITLNGTVITTDWGLPEATREITVANIVISQENYNILQQFKDDTTVTSWVFAYKNDCWDVLLKTLSAEYLGSESGYLATINMSVIQRLTGALDALLS